MSREKLPFTFRTEQGLTHFRKLYALTLTVGSVMQSAVPCSDDFYNHLHNAKERNGWIDFDSAIPSGARDRKRLYVRECYKTIASAIFSGCKKSIVTGIPNVGTSYFQFYLLWRLVQEKKRVLFVLWHDVMYYDGHGKILSLHEPPLPMESTFWTRDLWCLFYTMAKDAGHLAKVPYDDCNFVLLSNPKPMMLKDFQRPPAPQWFFIPTWSEWELDTLSCLYPKVTNWENNLKLHGGFPLVVFEPTTYQHDINEKACQAYSLDGILYFNGPKYCYTRKSYEFFQLVHIVSEFPYTESSFCFASQAIINRLAQSYSYDLQTKMESLLDACEGNPLVNALCECTHEMYVIKAFERGGNFTCRRLEQGQEETMNDDKILHIPPSMRQIVDEVLDNQTSNQRKEHVQDLLVVQNKLLS